jgi:hypothetical protein
MITRALARRLAGTLVKWSEPSAPRDIQIWADAAGARASAEAATQQRANGRKVIAG